MSMFRRRLMIANALGKSDGNINYPGLIAAWSSKGKTNDDEDREILKDLTGNGHDIILNDFAFNTEGSGYGGYQTNFNSWEKNFFYDRADGIIEDYKIIINKFNRSNLAIIYIGYRKKNTFKITGLSEGQSIIFGNDNSNYTLLEVAEDGIYEVDWTKQSYQPCIMGSFIGECNITIEVVPYYPDALVFNGVDDYGINEDIPILTDYTLIVKRNNFNDRSTLLNGIISKRVNFPATNAAFMFEKDGTWNFGKRNSVPIIDSLITYQTSYIYNGIEIQKRELLDTDKILIGCGGMYSNGSRVEYSKFAFYSAYLFDRSLDEQEIKAFVRKYIDADYLLPSEQEN